MNLKYLYTAYISASNECGYNCDHMYIYLKTQKIPNNTTLVLSRICSVEARHDISILDFHFLFKPIKTYIYHTYICFMFSNINFNY